MFNPSNKDEMQKYAIPVGTGNVVEIAKFIFEQRDKTCNKCKNGYKSIVPKTIGTKIYNIPVICVCVPYIQSQDAEGNLVVLYKGFRETWPGKVRPELYTQKEISLKSAISKVKDKFDNRRKLSGAHPNIKVGQYVVGNKMVAPKENKSVLEKSLEAQARPAASVKKIQKDEFTTILEGKQKASFRNKEGNIVVLDIPTAKRMMAQGLLYQRVSDVEAASAGGQTPVSAPAPEPAPIQASSPAPAPIPIPQSKSQTKRIEAQEPRRGRGRPAGSKNKPKKQV